MKVLPHAGNRIKILGLSSPQPSYHAEHATTANKEETLIKCRTIYKLVLRVTLANDQLYAQFLYFIIPLLQSSTCFEQRRAQHQEVKLY